MRERHHVAHGCARGGSRGTISTFSATLCVAMRCYAMLLCDPGLCTPRALASTITCFIDKVEHLLISIDESPRSLIWPQNGLRRRIATSLQAPPIFPASDAVVETPPLGSREAWQLPMAPAWSHAAIGRGIEESWHGASLPQETHGASLRCSYRPTP